jgi:hypothetical protein
VYPIIVNYLFPNSFWLGKTCDNKQYWLYFNSNDKLMKITDGFRSFVENLPIDPNLTPENFEQKIKLYLNFM